MASSRVRSDLVTFSVHFHFALGAFLAIFPIFLGFVRISWGTPTIYFADFGAFLTTFGQYFFLAFFAKKWLFGPGIRVVGRNRYSTGWGVYTNFF